MSFDRSHAPLHSAADARRLDHLMSKAGTSVAELMQNAGTAVAKVIVKIAKDRGFSNPQFVIFLGTGNNAGDGLVAAKQLHEIGSVQCVRVFPAKLPTDAPSLYGIQINECQIREIPTISIKDFCKLHSTQMPSHEQIWIDAVFGVGFRSAEMPTEWTDFLKIWNLDSNGPAAPVRIAIDIPSGLMADETPPIQSLSSQNFANADATLALDCLKYCHLGPAGIQACGDVQVLDIGINSHFRNANVETVLTGLLEPSESGLWESLPETSHKFDRGHVLILGGDDGTEGAADLAAMAAYRGGAGWVSVATAGPFKFTTDWRELVRVNLYDDVQQKIDSRKLRNYLHERKVSTVLLGPGWRRNYLDKESLSVLAEYSQINSAHRQTGFVIFDAGALHGLWKHLGSHLFAARKTLGLPHPGEWKKLLSGVVLAEELDPSLNLEALIKCQEWIRKENKMVLVYKNACPIVFDPSPTQDVLIQFPSRVLARAGSGDVIAGVTAAAAPRTDSFGEAFYRAYSSVRLAANEAAQMRGQDSVVASDYLTLIGRYI